MYFSPSTLTVISFAVVITVEDGVKLLNNLAVLIPMQVQVETDPNKDNIGPLSIRTMI